MDERVSIKSGLSHLQTEVGVDETVDNLYERLKTALNLGEKDSLNVKCEGRIAPYSEVQYDVVEPGAEIEFIKQSGSKG